MATVQLGAAIQRGVLASRPASGDATKAGQLYFATDTGLFYHDNGTSWTPVDPAIVQSLAALATTGLLAQTAAGTAAARTLTAGSGKLTVTNGNGVSGNPTVDVGTLTSGDIPNNAADPTFPSYPASGFYADGVTRLSVDNVYPDASNGDIYVGGNVSGSGSTKIMRLASGGDPTGAWQDLGADTAIPTLAGNSVDLHYRGITGG